MSYIETGSLDIKDMYDFQRVEDNLVDTLQKGTNKSEYSPELKAIFLALFTAFPRTEKARIAMIDDLREQLVLDHFDSVWNEIEDELSDEEFLPSLQQELRDEIHYRNERL